MKSHQNPLKKLLVLIFLKKINDFACEHNNIFKDFYKVLIQYFNTFKFYRFLNTSIKSYLNISKFLDSLKILIEYN